MKKTLLITLITALTICLKSQTTVLLKKDVIGSCFKIGNINYQTMGISATSITVYTYSDYYYLKNDLNSYVSKSDYQFKGQISSINVAYDSLLTRSWFKTSEKRILENLPIYVDTIWESIIPSPTDTSIHRIAGVGTKDLIVNPLAKTAVIWMTIRNTNYPELDHKISFQIDNTDSIQGVPTYNYFDGARITYNWDWPTTVRYGIQYCPPAKFDDR